MRLVAVGMFDILKVQGIVAVSAVFLLHDRFYIRGLEDDIELIIVGIAFPSKQLVELLTETLLIGVKDLSGQRFGIADRNKRFFELIEIISALG